MSKKIYNVAIKIGEYTNDKNEKKNKYLNVGAIVKKEGDDTPFLLLDRTFNPAGVPNPENKSNILLSFFKTSEKEGGNGEGAGEHDIW